MTHSLCCTVYNVYMFACVYTFDCVSLYFYVCMVYFVPVMLCAHLLKRISFLADHDHGYGLAERRGRSDLFKEQPAASS
jgi:hypothetical protein